MKIRFGSKYIDQIWILGKGWITIAPIRLRDLDRPVRSELAKQVGGVHIVGLGDYTMQELKRRTREIGTKGQA